MGSHTILLVQPKDSSTRTYYDFTNVGLMCEAIMAMYEKRLKQLNPRSGHINYHIDDLRKFIDNFSDISALVFNAQTVAYLPHDREWIKNNVYGHLKRLAQK
ncbi:hypothetical protein IWQ60_001139 [Tieghemiomyces parasiticus]|uniref:Enhancer of rudimentary homolog n=1 Tax=Tieghemiomyces parasiticus TaxID=78921 RepID=A0A9W8ALK8_9FUNG|nr:hypothetical protein IWQ60_001139 [Tieghemiomyces parasiticus]